MLNLSFWLYIFHGWPRQPFDWKVFQMENNKTQLRATEYASKSDKLALMRCKSIKRIAFIMRVCAFVVPNANSWAWFHIYPPRCAHILLFGFLLYRISEIGQKDCQWIPIIVWKSRFFIQFWTFKQRISRLFGLKSILLWSIWFFIQKSNLILIPAQLYQLKSNWNENQFFPRVQTEI